MRKWRGSRDFVYVFEAQVGQDQRQVRQQVLPNKQSHVIHALSIKQWHQSERGCFLQAFARLSYKYIRREDKEEDRLQVGVPLPVINDHSLMENGEVKFLLIKAVVGYWIRMRSLPIKSFLWQRNHHVCWLGELSLPTSGDFILRILWNSSPENSKNKHLGEFSPSWRENVLQIFGRCFSSPQWTEDTSSIKNIYNRSVNTMGTFFLQTRSGLSCFWCKIWCVWWAIMRSQQNHKSAKEAGFVRDEEATLNCLILDGWQTARCFIHALDYLPSSEVEEKQKSGETTGLVRMYLSDLSNQGKIYC